MPNNRTLVRRLAGLIRRPERIPSAIQRRLTTRSEPRESAPSARKQPREIPEISPRRYPELVIGVAGNADFFEGLVRTVDATQVAHPDDHLDLILLDLTAEEPLDDYLPILESLQSTPTTVIARADHHLRRANQVGIPAVCAIADLLPRSQEVAHLPPLVDPHKHNPMGWVRSPSERLAYVSPDIAAPLDPLLEPFVEWVSPMAFQRITGATLSEFRAAFVSPAAYESTTDYLRAVLRVGAAGIPILSPTNDWIEETLPYLPASTSEEVGNALARLSDDAERERISILVRRQIFTAHTPANRLELIIARVGLRLDPPDMISVLASTKRPEQLGHLLDSFVSQDWPEKELVLLLHGPERFDSDAIASALQAASPVQVIECDADLTLGEVLNMGLSLANGAFISKMDDDDHYGPMHLTDLMVAATYANASAVGKLANPTYLSESDVTVDWRITDQEKGVHHLPGATMLVRKDVLDRYRFSRVNRSVDATLWRRMTKDGHRIYSTHWLNFVRVRHGDNTYKRSEQDFIRHATLRAVRGIRAEEWFL